MKIWVSINLLFTSLVGLAAAEDDFVITVKTDVSGTTDQTSFIIPTSGTGYNYNVDCNDDGVNEANALTGEYTCDYSNLGGEGTYTIRVKDNSGSGTGFPRFVADRFPYNANKIMSLDQWGTGRWQSMADAFASTRNMMVLATDAPNLSAVTDMSKMFFFTQFANFDASDWDVSSVTDMSEMFAATASESPDVSKWDVSSVTDMNKMFGGTSLANPDVSNWDVSSVTDMSNMFWTTETANPDVSNWDVSSVIDMTNMFWTAESANPDVSNWDVSSVTSMRRMFEGAGQANPDVTDWDVSSVTDMRAMFSSAILADPDVSGWNVSSVTNFGYMFRMAVAADPDVSAWNVSSATTMEVMFSHASSAQPDVSHWDVSSVTNMFRMFFRTTADPDVSSWDVSSVKNMETMFADSYLANPDVSSWDVSSVTDMSFMFGNTFSAKPDVSHWNVSSVTDMYGLFAGTTADLDVSDWDVSSVTTMAFMFAANSRANPDVSQWDVSSVTNMEGMFQGARSARPNIGNWNVSSVNNMIAMFNEVSLPPWLYDDILVSFVEQTLESDVPFDAGDSHYCRGLLSRNNIVNSYGWVIEDAGLNCGSDVSIEFVQNNQLLAYNQSHEQRLMVTNTGFQDVTGASITSEFSTGHANLTWTCQVIAGNGVCPADNGVGDLSEKVDLQVNDQLSFVFSFDLIDDNQLSATAHIELVVPEDDIYLPNNFSAVVNVISKISQYTSGSWFDAENPGHGVFLEVLEGQESQADRLNIFWFTHHESEPIWLGGVGEIINGELVNIDLKITSGANSPPNFNATDVVAEDWGQVTMNFQSPHSIKMAWETLPAYSAFGAGEVSFTQLSNVSESMAGCYSGSFFDPNQSGHGFFIHVTDAANNQEQINVSWFTYHEGKLFWLIGSGMFDEDQANSIPLNQFTGASFFNPLAQNGWSFNSDELDNTNWGDLTLMYTDENNINITYQPHDTGQFEAGELTVTRLTSMKGHACN